MSSELVPPAPLPEPAASQRATLLPEPTRAWAVGMLMATLSGAARLAEGVPAAAAATAGLSVNEAAQAMVVGSRGTPVPARLRAGVP